MKDRMGGQDMRYLTAPKNREESSAEILAMLVTLSLSVNEVRATWTASALK